MYKIVMIDIWNYIHTQVDAVLHDSAFANIYNLPIVGSKGMTYPPTLFCLDGACREVPLNMA